MHNYGDSALNLQRRIQCTVTVIRLVYIDPPFNTNADVQHYNDSMARALWLSMIRDRLLALRPLLAENASVWVHLDDAEVHRARAVMDEVFGDNAFVASVIWQKKTTRDSRAAFSTNHDTILVYAPSGPKKWKASRNLLVKDTAYLVNRDMGTRGSAQRAFANKVKNNYELRCAITGISTKTFLVAAHIVPWSQDQSIRLDPSNGICLSLLMDRAFENGYLIIEDDTSIVINWRRVGTDTVLQSLLKPYDGKKLTLPRAHAPKPDYLRRRKQYVGS